MREGTRSSHITARLRTHGITAATLTCALASTGETLAQTEYVGVLEEVTVTAQFRRENLQSTPIAITAVNAEMLEARNQTSVQQIADQAPNVTLKPAGASSGPSLIGFIRGIGQTDFNFATEPGVGMYVDDVYYSTLTGSVLDLLDLERVEVLRGPQGTLAGKNSIGGAIKLFSKKPQGTGTGYVQVTYGSLDRTEVRASGDFSLVPGKVMVRVSGVSKQQDGYVDRVDYACSHPGSGLPTYTTRGDCLLGTEGGISYTAARASLRWIATDALEINLIADITNDTSEATANVLTAATPTAPLNSGFDANGNAVALLGATPAIAFDCRFVPYGPNSCDPNGPNKYVNYSTYVDPRARSQSPVFDGGSPWAQLSIPPVRTLQARGASMALDWQIADELTLTSITAWRKYESAFGDDADGSPVMSQLLYQHLVHSQKSEEIRLNGTFRSMLEWTVGGFYFDQDSAEDARISLQYAGLDFIHGPDNVPATTWAVFAHTNWRLTDQLSVSLGARYSDEEKTYTYRRVNPDGTLPPACTIPFAPPFLNGQPWNCAIFGMDGESSTFAGTRTDYRAAVSYRWSDTFMTYAQFSTGYKGGGINPRAFYPSQIQPFEPETLDAYEIGFKSELFDRRMRLNVSAFYNEYADIQLLLNECSAIAGAGFGFPCAMPSNAGDAEVKGAELEAAIYPVPGLQMDAAVSYLDFEFTRVEANTGLTLNDITPYTPETKWSAGIQYELRLGNGGSVTPRIDASYQSEVHSAPARSATNRIDAYTTVNGRITWRSPEEDWQIALEGSNLTNEYYYLTIFDLTGPGGGFAAAQPGMPRQWALTVKHQF